MALLTEKLKIKSNIIIRLSYEQGLLFCYILNNTIHKLHSNCLQIDAATITDLLNKYKSLDPASEFFLEDLKKVGGIFYDYLVCDNLKYLVNKTAPGKNIIFEVTPKLEEIPWELIYTGEFFIFEKFLISRKNFSALIKKRNSLLTKTLNVLMLQHGKASAKKFSAYKKYLLNNHQKGLIKLQQINARLIDERAFISAFEWADIVHFDGNLFIDKKSRLPWRTHGFMLGEGKVVFLEQLKKCQKLPHILLLTPTVPDLAFSTRLSAFLRELSQLGVKNVITNYWHDTASKFYGLSFQVFIKAMLESDYSLGKAVAKAREVAFTESEHKWSGNYSFLMYGKPEYTFKQFSLAYWLKITGIIAGCCLLFMLLIVNIKLHLAVKESKTITINPPSKAVQIHVSNLQEAKIVYEKSNLFFLEKNFKKTLEYTNALLKYSDALVDDRNSLKIDFKEQAYLMQARVYYLLEQPEKMLKIIKLYNQEYPRQVKYKQTSLFLDPALKILKTN